MDITETLYVPTREAWRDWLHAHHADRSEIWLVTYRKATGRPSVGYNDAVEEALCVGWIDSIRKGLDADRLAQRFTPRRPASPFSQTNKERLARLLSRGQVLPSVAAGLPDVRPEAFEMPADILDALRADPEAWRFFQSTAPSYQRIRAAYVDDKRAQPEEFGKRLRRLVEMSAQGKTYGYHIETYT